MSMNFSIVVVGAGHAGLEAAFACAHLGHKVALITLNKQSIGLMPCNPSIGGPAKGIVAREIDVLGGLQAIAADQNQLQMKMLNTSKGPGVWALRAQIDKLEYHKWFVNQINKTKNISLIEDEVKELIIEKSKIKGVILSSHKKCFAKTVILTTGTYMKSLTHIGDETKNEGPKHLKRSENLSDNLKKLGFELLRLKTGTPPRIDQNTVNYKAIQKELGTNKFLSFSHFNQIFLEFNKQLPCHLTFTNKKTHQIILRNIKKSATYSGQIKGVGPRYCPSIEDKVIRFKDRERHQLFLEPESLSLSTIYIQGLSNAFPKNIQNQIVHSISGLEKAKILEYAYAIEYDAINPIQLKLSLESKKINHLYFAGQVNGTSGYEEAACQGLMAGINACLQLQNKKPLIIKRHEGYIGVLIDDLVTKGVTDPYRLLTSRAEYRLSLRNDNADERLLKYGYQIGLINKDKYSQFKKNLLLINNIIKYLHTHSLTKMLRNKFGSSTHTLYDLLKRTDVSLKDVLPPSKFNILRNDLIEKIEIKVKFDGYIKNQEKYINKFEKYESFSLEQINDYKNIKNLSLEAIDKLNKVRPVSLGQAQRISGINLTDLFIIKHYVDTKILHHE